MHKNKTHHFHVYHAPSYYIVEHAFIVVDKMLSSTTTTEEVEYADIDLPKLMCLE
jgi:hypothetical protein